MRCKMDIVLSKVLSSQTPLAPPPTANRFFRAMLRLLVPAIPGFDHRLSDLSSLEIHQVGDELAQVRHLAAPTTPRASTSPATPKPCTRRKHIRLIPRATPFRRCSCNRRPRPRPVCSSPRPT